MKILIFLFCNIVALSSFSQTEEEKRAIAASVVKIKSDSTSLHSRSERLKEKQRTIEILEDALRGSNRTIKLHMDIDSMRVQDLVERDVQINALQTKVTELETDNDKQRKKKRTWTKIAIGEAIMLGVGIALKL